MSMNRHDELVLHIALPTGVRGEGTGDFFSLFFFSFFARQEAKWPA